MSKNGAHLPRLEIEMVVNVTNADTGRGYSVASETLVQAGDDRKVTVLNLLDDILGAKMTKEMREVEGWPL